ncbi:MAG: DUF6471 domain-containing protein [Pseudomonadota bacterium]
MNESIDWEVSAKNLLKAELRRKGVTYAELSIRLADLGLNESEANIRNKVARGKFKVAFLLQCLRAIGTSGVQIEFCPVKANGNSLP